VQSIPLWDLIADADGRPDTPEPPPTFDELGLDAGIVVYETTVATGGALAFGEVRDLAWVYIDGELVGRIAREKHERSVEIPRGGHLRVLVECLGRVNYGPRLGEPVGLVGGATLDGEPLAGWTATPLGQDALTNLAESCSVGDFRAPEPGNRSETAHRTDICAPVFAVYDLRTDAPGDAYLDTSGWGDGIAWANGFCLGRFRSLPPQDRLYIPAPVLAPKTRIVALHLPPP
jgi:beta-galactosidase